MVDFEFEHSVETSAGAQAVWALWSEVDRWVEWDTSVQKVTLDGPFEVGSSGIMHIEGMPPLAFRLTEVLPGVGFTDETAIPGGVVRFGHRLEPVGDRVRVTHWVEVDGPGEMGPVIVEDVPEAMEALVRLAEKA
jgi:polyketide cyclase/dehydrase/lipid transport protein